MYLRQERIINHTLKLRNGFHKHMYVYVYASKYTVVTAEDAGCSKCLQYLFGNGDETLKSAPNCVAVTNGRGSAVGDCGAVHRAALRTDTTRYPTRKWD